MMMKRILKVHLQELGFEVDSEEEQRCYTFNSDHTVICWANNYGAEGEKFNLTWSATKTHESNVSQL